MMPLETFIKQRQDKAFGIVYFNEHYRMLFTKNQWQNFIETTGLNKNDLVFDEVNHRVIIRGEK